MARLAVWAFLNIILPISPLLSVRLFLQADVDIFQGTEFFLLSLTILAATKFELGFVHNHLKANPEKANLFIMPLMLITAIILGIVYSQNNLSENNLNVEAVSLSSRIIALASIIICLNYQLQIIRVMNSLLPSSK